MKKLTSLWLALLFLLAPLTGCAQDAGVIGGADGRTYTECDIDTAGADERGAKRIVFSNDGLIFYTEDHYQTFTLLLGDGQDEGAAP